VNGGGFFNIEKVEVKPDHQGNDLGLRIIHEALTLLKGQWTLAVVMPAALGRHRCCAWEGN
jgi:hypothetical protein